MANEARNEANRENALQSTGPRTPEGLARSATNAMRHGLCATKLLLPNESVEEFKEFEAEWLSSLGPVGQAEEFLADQVIRHAWRLRRVPWFETGVIATARYEIQAAKSKQEAEALRQNPFADAMGTVDGEPKPEDLEAYRQARQGQWDAEEAQSMEPALSGRAFRRAEESDALTRLNRYETTIARNLIRFLHELQRLQAARSDEPIPPPAALDVSGLDENAL